MTEYEPGTDVWVDGFQGPRCAVFQRGWPDKNKVLVEFHGSPEIVSGDNVFADKSACYTFAAQRLADEAMGKLRASTEYHAVAAGNDHIGAE